MVTSVFIVESLHSLVEINTTRVTLYSVITYLAQGLQASRVISLDEESTDVVRQEPP